MSETTVASDHYSGRTVDLSGVVTNTFRKTSVARKGTLTCICS